jgi:glycosyltransferase involved in cell wall biosynthesis
MLSVFVANCVYPPEPMVSARIGSDLANYLQEAGMDVEVICPMPSRPAGVVYSEVQLGTASDLSVIGGVRVRRVSSYTAPQSRLLPRLRESASFGRASSVALRKSAAKPEAVYANTWPMMAQWQLAWTCRRLGIPLIIHIQDLYPESLLERLPSALRLVVKGPLTALDAWMARQATALVVVSQSVAEAYRFSRGLRADKVTVVNNWIDEDAFNEMPDRAVAHRHYGLDPASFTFLYCGNVGAVAKVETLLNAFSVTALGGAKLVIAGGGSGKARCLHLARERNMKNVHFVSDEAAENTARLHSLGDVCLLPMRAGAMESSVPSKLISYMMSRRPIVATVNENGTMAKEIRAADCGWVGPSEDDEWLAQQMREAFAMNRHRLDEMGRKGRAYAQKHFSRARGLELLSGVIKRSLKAEAATVAVAS